MTAGTSALGNLQSLLGLNGDAGNQWAANAQTQLQNSPGYQFQYNQGQEALDRSAASRGLALSGAQLKDSQAYGQGFAQNSWNSYLQQFSNLANQGENAAAGVGQIGQQTGQNIGQSQMAAGQGVANAVTGGVNGFNQALGNLTTQQNVGGGGYSNGNFGFGGTETPNGWNSGFSGQLSSSGVDGLGGYSSFSPSDLNVSMPTLNF